MLMLYCFDTDSDIGPTPEPFCLTAPDLEPHCLTATSRTEAPADMSEDKVWADSFGDKVGKTAVTYLAPCCEWKTGTSMLPRTTIDAGTSPAVHHTRWLPLLIIHCMCTSGP